MRERLLDAALTLFEAQGYDGTTIDEIAARADVARQTVLNHYPQKHDFIEGWGVRRRALTLVADGEDEPVAMLRGAFARLAEVNVRERKLGRAIRDQMIVPQPVPDGFLAAVALGRERGAFRAPLPDRAIAEVLAGLYYDTVQRWLALDDEPFDLAAELGARLDLILLGLSTTR